MNLFERKAIVHVDRGVDEDNQLLSTVLQVDFEF